MRPEKRPLNVFVVEDSEILTKLLVSMLRADLGVHVVGNCGDAATAIDKITLLQPDVAIVDLVLASGNGFEVLDAVRRSSPATVPLVLSNHSTPTYREAASRLGVPDEHYFDKTEQIGMMCTVIRRMADQRAKGG